MTVPLKGYDIHLHTSPDLGTVTHCPYHQRISECVNKPQKGATSQDVRGSWPDRAAGVSAAALGILIVPLKGSRSPSVHAFTVGDSHSI